MERGFPGSSVVKNLSVNAGDADSIPGSGRFPWRRKWQPTPVFLPGKSHRQRSLATAHGVTQELDITKKQQSDGRKW